MIVATTEAKLAFLLCFFFLVFTGKKKPVLKLPKEVFEQPPPAAV